MDSVIRCWALSAPLAQSLFAPLPTQLSPSSILLLTMFMVGLQLFFIPHPVILLLFLYAVKAANAARHCLFLPASGANPAFFVKPVLFLVSHFAAL